MASGGGRLVFEQLLCAHCREPLPDSIGPNSGLCRCSSCRRVLLVRERVLGIRLAKGGVLPLVYLVMLLCPAVALVSAPLLAYSTEAYMAVLMCCVCAMGTALAHDGWLSVRTGRDCSPGPGSCPVYGLEAAFLGLCKLAAGGAVAVGALYMLVRDLVQ